MVHYAIEIEENSEQNSYLIELDELFSVLALQEVSIGTIRL